MNGNNNGLLVCSPAADYKNIGDYIQSVAQEIFLPHVDVWVEREHLDTFRSESRTNVIMNGWFMWNPSNFPPSSSINPLFVSFHIVPSIEKSFFTEKTIEYLKRYEPIGARDMGTKALLEKYGINSYFSGCLTLCLGLCFKKQDKSKGIVFVDPYYPLGGTKVNYKKIGPYFKSFSNLAKNFFKARKFYKIFSVEQRTIFRFISKRFEKLYAAANFYEYYHHSFTDEVLFNAEYITHNVHTKNCKDNNVLMDYAKQLVKKYANSSLVVTSRIHCGLPCLGVETPCIFVYSNQIQNIRNGGRFGGLLDLFHVATLSKHGLVGVSEEMSQLFAGSRQFTIEDQVSVKKDYITLRDQLTETVEQFLKREK